MSTSALLGLCGYIEEVVLNMKKNRPYKKTVVKNLLLHLHMFIYRKQNASINYTYLQINHGGVYTVSRSFSANILYKIKIVCKGYCYRGLEWINMILFGIHYS